MLGVGLDTVDGAYAHTGWVIIMADAFGAFTWLYLINLRTHINGTIRALGFAHIAVNAFVVDQ